ncbi:MAG: SDR family NAD(P)-dependent oxidoreductase [bacterium]
MIGRRSPISALVYVTGSSISFFVGSALYGTFSATGLRQILMASLVFLVLNLVCYPLLEQALSRSYVQRVLVTLLSGLSVIALLGWIPGASLASATILSGVVAAGLGGEITRTTERWLRSRDSAPESRPKSVLVVGAGEAGEMLLRQVQHQPGLYREVVGFLDDDPEKQGEYINGDSPVLGKTDDLVPVCRDHDVDEVIIAMPSVDGEVIRSVISQRSSLNADMRIVPGIKDIIEGDFRWNQIRPVKPEDLLGRETVEVDRSRLGDFLRGKTVLVTGAAGSIGSYLVQHLLEHPVSSVVGLDFNESNLYELEVSELNQSKRSRFSGVLSDVRDAESCREVIAKHKPDVVLHAAALKHVPMVERHPLEGIKTNVKGCINVFEAVAGEDVEHCLLISTDKAVNPKNVMGYTKKMGERLVATYQRTTDDTRYAAVRFGNVLGSRGSVVPLFKRQIEDGGPVTVTDPEMVRYFMTPSEAVKLVLTAASFDHHGSTYVLDIGDPISIMDLAHQLIALMGYEPETDIPIEIVGLREGESLEETLWSDDVSPERTDHSKIRRIDASPLSEETLNSFRAFLSSPPKDSKQLIETFKNHLFQS